MKKLEHIALRQYVGGYLWTSAPQIQSHEKFKSAQILPAGSPCWLWAVSFASPDESAARYGATNVSPERAALFVRPGDVFSIPDDVDVWLAPVLPSGRPGNFREYDAM
jgi:hypothetical protein